MKTNHSKTRTSATIVLAAAVSLTTSTLAQAQYTYPGTASSSGHAAQISPVRAGPGNPVGNKQPGNPPCPRNAHCGGPTSSGGSNGDGSSGQTSGTPQGGYSYPGSAPGNANSIHPIRAGTVESGGYGASHPGRDGNSNPSIRRGEACPPGSMCATPIPANNGPSDGGSSGGYGAHESYGSASVETGAISAAAHPGKATISPVQAGMGHGALNYGTSQSAGSYRNTVTGQSSGPNTNSGGQQNSFTGPNGQKVNMGGDQNLTGPNGQAIGQQNPTGTYGGGYGQQNGSGVGYGNNGSGVVSQTGGTSGMASANGLNMSNGGQAGVSEGDGSGTGSTSGTQQGSANTAGSGTVSGNASPSDNNVVDDTPKTNGSGGTAGSAGIASQSGTADDTLKQAWGLVCSTIGCGSGAGNGTEVRGGTGVRGEEGPEENNYGPGEVVSAVNGKVVNPGQPGGQDTGGGQGQDNGGTSGGTNKNNATGGYVVLGNAGQDSPDKPKEQGMLNQGAIQKGNIDPNPVQESNGGH